MLLLVKKVVIVAVGSAVINFLALHVSAAIGGCSIMWVAIPLVVYMGYKIALFPDKIGEEVSKSVRKRQGAVGSIHTHEQVYLSQDL